MEITRTILGLYGANTPKALQTYPVNVGTAAVQALPQDPSAGKVSASYAWRSTVAFHNPGSVDVYVCQALDSHGNPITPAVAGVGMLRIAAGTLFVIDAPGTQAWNAIAASSAVLTILEYLS